MAGGERWDSKGRVPFAVVAVLVLLLSTMSTVYLSALTKRYADDRETRLSLERLSWVSESVSSEIEAAAYSEAMRAVALSTQFYENATRIDGEFQSGFADYLAGAFPGVFSGCRVTLEECSVWVMPSDRSCVDSVESIGNVSEDIVTSQEEDAPAAEGSALDNARPDEVNETELPSFYTVAGHAEVTVEAENGMKMKRAIEVEREIQTPYPLLRAKLDTIAAGGDGAFSPIARVVKYVLTTLAQFKVLEGYGSGLAGSPGSTASVVSQADVELAMNLGVVLEIARRLRAADPAALAALGDGGALGSLVQEYAWNGTLDPADIVVLHRGLDTRQVPVDMILAQGFNAVIDQFILKLLDYLGIMKAADKVYGVVASLAEAVEGTAKTLCQWLGSDDGEDVDGAGQAMRWTDKTMRLLGSAYPPRQTDVPQRLVPHGGDGRPNLMVSDVLTEVDASASYQMLCDALVDEDAAEVRNATGDVIGTEHLLTIRSLDYSLTTKTSAQAGFAAGYLVKFEEADLTRSGNEALWNDFYANNYSENVDLTYDTLREEIKALCSYAAAEVAGYFAARDTSLSGFAGGAFAPDPLDNASLLDDLTGMLDSASGECFGYYSSNRAALKGIMMGVIGRQEKLKEDLARFISLHYGDFADEGAAVDSAASSLAAALWGNATLATTYSDSVLTYNVYNAAGLAQGYVDELRPAYDYDEVPAEPTIRAELANGNAAAMDSFATPYAQSSYVYLAMEESRFVGPYSQSNGYVVKALESDALETGNFIVDTIVSAAYDWGFFPSAEDFVLRSIKAIVGAGEVANLAFRPIALLGTVFSLESEGGVIAELRPSVRMSPSHLGAFDVSGGLAAPDGEFSYALSEPTGTHYTDLLKYNARPFETTWSLTVSGEVGVETASDKRDLFYDGSHAATEAKARVPISFSISICVYSGWDLVGVEYVNSATLAGDLGRLADMVKEFFSWVLDTIMAPIKWLIDQVTKLVDILGNVLNRLLSCAQRIVQIISEVVQMAAEMLQEFIKDVARQVLDSVMGWLLDWLPDGLTIDFELFGFRFTARFDPEGALDENSPADDVSLLDLTIGGNLLGARLGMGMSLLRLGRAAKNQTGSEYDILFDAKVGAGGFAIDIAIDPLMAASEFMVEAHGGAPGWKLDFALPVAERRYDTFGYSLQDIAGVGAVLQNIPIPFLGAKASVDAGFEVAYSEPGFLPDHIVINEVEVNPRGSDNGTERVELFNPFKEQADLSGWSIFTCSNGTLGNRTVVLGEGSSIPARGFLVVGMPDERLDDGGCRLSLANPSGAVVDSTHWLKEPPGAFVGNQIIPETGGASTWQRSPNAADADLSLDWAFRQGTLNASNGAGNATFRQLVMATLERAFRSAWDEAGGLQMSFEYFVGIARATIEKFVEDVLDLVEASVIEVRFFLEVELTDASGSVGGGVSLSFIIEGGETARQILEWLVGSLEAFAENLVRPSAPAKFPRLDSGVPEHLYLRFEGYGIVSTPKMLGKLAPGSSAPAQLKLVGRIEANVPALAVLVGKDMGRWRVNFGLYLEDVPGSLLHKILGSPENENVDLWMLKGSAYEV
ncbi:MAG: lamin tail domain-containing protein [Methanobacteriota archaeon]